MKEFLETKVSDAGCAGLLFALFISACGVVIHIGIVHYFLNELVHHVGANHTSLSTTAVIYFTVRFVCFTPSRWSVSVNEDLTFAHQLASVFGILTAGGFVYVIYMLYI